MSEQPELAETLEDLTSQQMGFVQSILSGSTQSDAYRDNYNTANMLSATIHAAASRLRAHCKVDAWISLGRRQGMARATVTLEGHLAELESLKEECKASGNYGAAVKAEELRGKAAGVYLGDDTGKLAKIPAAQLLALVREGIGGQEGEQAALKLAERLGVTLLPKRTLTIEHDEADTA